MRARAPCRDGGGLCPKSCCATIDSEMRNARHGNSISDIREFVTAACEASYFAAPDHPGLIPGQLVSIGKAFSLHKGEICDAIENALRAGHLSRDGNVLVPGRERWHRLHTFDMRAADDLRNPAAFDAVHSFFVELARVHGVRHASAERDAVARAAVASGNASLDEVKAAIAIFVLVGHLKLDSTDRTRISLAPDHAHWMPPIGQIRGGHTYPRPDIPLKRILEATRAITERAPTPDELAVPFPNPPGPLPPPSQVSLPAQRPPMPQPTIANGSFVTVVFISITDLTSMDGPRAHAAISTLHRVLREQLIDTAAVPAVRILSSLTGAIVVVPSTSNIEPVDDVAIAAANHAHAARIAVRIGVAHGPIEALDDADRTSNLIGPCVNIAARLAHSKLAPPHDHHRLLVHDSYVQHAASRMASDHWLIAGQDRVDVPGKRNEKFRCLAAPSRTAPFLTASTIPSASSTPPPQEAILLAYDLPSFSDGDLRTLSARFRDVVKEVSDMRSSGQLPKDTPFSFSPGGDGAVVALIGLHPEIGYTIADRLATKLMVASGLNAHAANVEVRIGLHYGHVFTYDNAESIPRPTGVAVFDTDAIVADKTAERSTVVVSESLIEPASLGSRDYLNKNFEPLTPLKRPHDRTIKRYARRRSLPSDSEAQGVGLDGGGPGPR